MSRVVPFAPKKAQANKERAEREQVAAWLTGVEERLQTVERKCRLAWAAAFFGTLAAFVVGALT